jgi:hypothetical protein
MNNKILGILIVILYFSNYHICEIIYPEGGIEWLKVRYSIYSILILLSINYKVQKTILEKIILAVIFNNIFVLLFKDETFYTTNDIYFIIIFTFAQYAKQLYRNFGERIFRNLALFFNIKK